MVHMEISLGSPTFVKIRGKRSAIAINPTDKTVVYNAALLINNPSESSLKIHPDAVIIDGPGEYEVGGIKVTGIKNDADVVYTINVDQCDILIGNLKSIEKVHTKLKDHHMILVHADEASDPAFLTSLSPNAVLVYGTQAESVLKSFGKDSTAKTNKYTTTVDKLPQEMETYLLA
jgi:hypothetical protein